MLSELFGKAYSYFQDGGVVMPALLVISIIMWMLILIKTFEFMSIKKSEVAFDKCFKSFRDGDSVPGAEWQKGIISLASEVSFMERKFRRRVMDGYTARLSDDVSKHVKTVLVLASSAPLLGLFGTVSGMIDTFNVISAYGTGNPKAMSSGISVALITTQAGLVVAVPGLIMGNFLKRRADTIKDRISIFSHMLVKELEHDV